MTETRHLDKSVAPLRNVAALVGLIELVEGRAPGLPGLGVFHGYSGYGKTTAANYCRNRFGSINVEVKSCWTGKKLCQAILFEMGYPRERMAKTIADMVDQIAHELMRSGRVLIIDDAQELTSKSAMIKLVKDIYESSDNTIIMIGEELLPTQLARWENIHGRILEWEAAKPACLDDVHHLARLYAPGIELAEGFDELILTQSRHSIRRVCGNLEKVREFARRHGVDRVDCETWGNQTFLRLDAPSPRRDLQ